MHVHVHNKFVAVVEKRTDIYIIINITKICGFRIKINWNLWLYLKCVLTSVVSLSLPYITTITL